MTTVNVTRSSFPTTLELVNRVLNECGVESFSSQTATGNNKQIGIVLASINDAVFDLNYRKRWNFQKTIYYEPLVAGQTDYPLPSGFMRLETPVMIGNTILDEFLADEFVQRVPFMDATSGTPIIFMVDGNYLKVWPSPTQNVVDTYKQMRYSFYKGPTERLTTEDGAATINLPLDFLEAVVCFAKWKFKTFLEYPDANIERARFDELVRLLMNKDDLGLKEYSLRPEYYPSGFRL